MMVTFVCQCEKKALDKSRRVLDSFASRIGDRTWQTLITQEGLNAVKKLLRKTASKNTAVACHWLRSRSRCELVWIVGNRQKFNHQGMVPVNTTQKTIANTQDENNWLALPLIQALAALAALFHDWGKASAAFQAKLQPDKGRKPISDALRHEWVSCLLLHAFINHATEDNDWLSRLSAGDFDELHFAALNESTKPLQYLPPAASLLMWLMVSHHRLPCPTDGDALQHLKDASFSAAELTVLLGHISASFGYRNPQAAVAECLQFPQGLPHHSPAWVKQVKKWAGKLQTQLPNLQQTLDNGSYRLVMYYARLSLMLGDYHYSSLPADKHWQSDLRLYANTDPANNALKQKLDEHLLGVCKTAVTAAYLLPRFESQFPKIYDIKSLKKRSTDPRFIWQDKAVDKIRLWKTEHPLAGEHFGFFAVNMASTGCGKTLANAKIMQALAPESEGLRFILALGLRTLTLQTGDEYQNRIGLDASELAVLIGSRAVQELHQLASKPADTTDTTQSGSESASDLLDDEVQYDFAVPQSTLDTVLGHHPGKRQRNLKFLHAPVLVCTLDHLMAATETIKGGRHILPSLRLLSSDLVIDEIDDFDGNDLIAIGRLIHLAGMCGRKVMISSATIPPAMAEGYFNAYQAGWQLFAQLRDIKTHIGCAWISETDTQLKTVPAADTQTYRHCHQAFIEKHATKLLKQPVKRIAEIIPIPREETAGELENSYFEAIQHAIMQQHQRHSRQHADKQISFGVVRMANIPPCIRLTQYLATSRWRKDVDIRVMAYHSQQLLIMRSAQERHLDEVLKHNRDDSVFEQPLIRQHLQASPCQHMIFILVATPVEEVGRDHDFDWAIVEPSSYRSIIQLAGRVLRHRSPTAAVTTNMSLLQYNLKALKQKTPAYNHPGYECKNFPLRTHDLQALIPASQLQAINALPRIRHNPQPIPDGNLADLEQASIQHLLTCYNNKTAASLQGWLSECWWLLGLPQSLTPFRQQEPQKLIYLLWDEDKNRWRFHEKATDGKSVVDIEGLYHIHQETESPELLSKLWLVRDYAQLLDDMTTRQDISLRQAGLRYGELNAPMSGEDNEKFVYWAQLGFCLTNKN